MSRTPKLSRRTLLRGTGVAISLPWLEAMTTPLARGATANTPPVRMAFFYVPNGVNMDDWRLGGAGPLGNLSPILSPLEPIKQHVSVLTGMAAEHCDGTTASHEPAGGGYLVGKKCKHSEEPEVGGASVDQIVARKIGYQTPIDSLTLGIDPGHRGDHGYSGTYMSHISWRDKQTPAALELNPKHLYDRLFRGQTLKRHDWNAAEQETVPADDSIESSVLDLVNDEAKSLQRELGFNDRRKLEAYLEGLRGIEKRIVAANRDSHSHHQDSFTQDRHALDDDPEIAKLIIPEGKGIPSVYADHVNLMLDIMTLAFQTDTTRVASFMFSYEKSGRSYPEIDAKGSHHSTSHHQKKQESLRQLTCINRHHVALFARMIQRMSEIQEGGGSLLDNVMLCYGSGISDGNKHNNDDLPVLLAGGGGGSIRGGQHRVYEDRTPLCNLYVEMLSKMGLRRKSFGDSNGRLDDLNT
jgi:hypothetical protein